MAPAWGRVIMPDGRQLGAERHDSGQRRRSHARQQFLPLESPKPAPSAGDPDRQRWLSETCAGFVATSRQNREYYRVLLETLWPDGHGIPGPQVTEDELRAAIDAYREARRTGPGEYKPYRDPFRRMRELSGEEGVTGIGHVGRVYQLVDLNLSEKRVPRTGLSDEDWSAVVRRQGARCAVCGRQEAAGGFDQDHKVPRVRGGGNELNNWQALCHECNNFKSTSCRGCELDCSACPWAFPEAYAPLRISPDNSAAVRSLAKAKGMNPHDFLNELLQGFLQENVLN